MSFIWTCKITFFCGCNGIRTHNLLVRKTNTQLFAAVIHTYSLVYKITVYFYPFFSKTIFKLCPCHDYFRDFRVNERFVICSQISFFYEARVFSSKLVQMFEKVSKSFSQWNALFIVNFMLQKSQELRKFLYFCYVMIRGFVLRKCIFITVSAILWKPDNPVSIVHDRWKHK